MNSYVNFVLENIKYVLFVGYQMTYIVTGSHIVNLLSVFHVFHPLEDIMLTKLTRLITNLYIKCGFACQDKILIDLLMMCVRQ